MVHAQESEIENGRTNFCRSEDASIEWKTGMEALLVEWKFQFLQWKFLLFLIETGNLEYVQLQ